MFARSLVLNSELSKRKQSKSILKVKTGDALAERQILHVCIEIHVNYVKF